MRDHHVMVTPLTLGTFLTRSGCGFYRGGALARANQEAPRQNPGVRYARELARGPAVSVGEGEATRRAAGT